MTEHKTFPGKVYTVSCAEDTTVVLPDPLGVKEAVVLECTAGQQLHVTATAGRLETSSDQAIVTELFKLAPCRGVAAMMLLRKAGGWLPRGFTELEYLESSGTQYFLIDEPFKKGSGIYADVQLVDSRLAQNGYYLYAYNLLFNSTYRLYAGLNGAARYIHNDEYGNYGSLLKAYSADGRYSLEYNFKNSGEKVLTTSAGTKTQEITAGYIKSATKFPLFAIWREYEGTSGVISASQRVYSIQITQGAELTRDLVPVLDAAGTPCLYDRVGKSCIYNAGSGTFGYRVKRTGEDIAPMSLRDPWRVAPSGVWAKLKAENELDVVADTDDVTGDGWEWYATVADAYEGLGVAMPDDF